MEFDEVQRRLDATFHYCEVRQSACADDRRHLAVMTDHDVDVVERVLTALLIDEDRWLIDSRHTVEKAYGLRVAFSIYSD